MNSPRHPTSAGDSWHSGCQALGGPAGGAAVGRPGAGQAVFTDRCAQRSLAVCVRPGEDRIGDPASATRCGFKDDHPPGLAVVAAEDVRRLTPQQFTLDVVDGAGSAAHVRIHICGDERREDGDHRNHRRRGGRAFLSGCFADQFGQRLFGLFIGRLSLGQRGGNLRLSGLGQVRGGMVNLANRKLLLQV